MSKKKSLIIAIIVFIVALVIFIHFSDNLFSLLLISMSLAVLPQDIYYCVKEYKGLLTISIFILAIGFISTSTLNTIIISFLLNTIYIEWIFEPKWESRKERIKSEITNNRLTNVYLFNEQLFNRNKKRIKTLVQLLFYSFSILPSATLEILKANKDDFSFLNKAYYESLHIFHLGINSPTQIKRLCFAPLFMAVFLFITVLAACNINELKVIRNTIIDLKKRDNKYWGRLKPNFDEEELLYIELKEKITTTPYNVNRCPWIDFHSDMLCTRCNFYTLCFTDE